MTTRCGSTRSPTAPASTSPRGRTAGRSRAPGCSWRRPTTLSRSDATYSPGCGDRSVTIGPWSSVEGMSRALIASICAVLMLGACTDSPDSRTPESDAARAAFTSAECPDDVEIMVVPKHSCGYVTTRLAGGTRSGCSCSRSNRDPVEQARSSRPRATSAPRRRTADWRRSPNARGAGSSSSTCRASGTPPRSWTAPRSTRSRRPPQPTRTEPCRGRGRHRRMPRTPHLEGHRPRGLRHRQHRRKPPRGGSGPRHRRSVAMGHGTTGAVAIEWARRYPDEVEALVLDSPRCASPPPEQWSTASSPRSAAVRRGGRLPAAVRRPRRSVARRPARPAAPAADPLSRRQARSGSTTRRCAGPCSGWPAGATSGSWIPALITESTSRRPGDILSRYADALADGPPLCAGYLPRCAGVPAVAVGAALSLNCPLVLDDPTVARAVPRLGRHGHHEAVGPAPGHPDAGPDGALRRVRATRRGTSERRRADPGGLLRRGPRRCSQRAGRRLPPLGPVGLARRHPHQPTSHSYVPAPAGAGVRVTWRSR